MRSDIDDELGWLRAIIEQIRDHAIFMIDPDGHNRTWNEGVLRLLGYSEEEFVGLHTRELFTPEDRPPGCRTGSWPSRRSTAARATSAG
jgi:PAS domain S-box-containing protein